MTTDPNKKYPQPIYSSFHPFLASLGISQIFPKLLNFYEACCMAVPQLIPEDPYMHRTFWIPDSGRSFSEFPPCWALEDPSRRCRGCRNPPASDCLLTGRLLWSACGFLCYKSTFCFPPLQVKQRLQLFVYEGKKCAFYFKHSTAKSQKLELENTMKLWDAADGDAAARGGLTGLEYPQGLDASFSSLW